MVLPLIIGAVFGVLTLLDVVSYAVTGEDFAYVVSDYFGWIDPGALPPGVDVVMGSSLEDFLYNNIYGLIALSGYFIVLFWVLTKPDSR